MLQTTSATDAFHRVSLPHFSLILTQAQLFGVCSVIVNRISKKRYNTKCKLLLYSYKKQTTVPENTNKVEAPNATG
jgi:hypothetical protein